MINRLRNDSKVLLNGIKKNFICKCIAGDSRHIDLMLKVVPVIGGRCPNRKVRVTELTSIFQPIRNVDTIKIKLYKYNIKTLYQLPRSEKKCIRQRTTVVGGFGLQL